LHGVFDGIARSCGGLDPFMAAALAQVIGGKPREKINDLA